MPDWDMPIWLQGVWKQRKTEERRRRIHALMEDIVRRRQQQMPCNDGYRQPAYNVEEISKSYIEQKAMLCALMTALQRQELLGQALEFYDEREAGVPVQRLRDWWDQHQREDIERRQRELAYKKQKLAEANTLLEKVQRGIDKLKGEIAAYE